jgi:hypothetical protein
MTRSKIDLSSDPAEVEFSESDRKNGAGTVEILIGEQYIREQINRLEKASDWNGHLLVDSDDRSQPMNPRDAAEIFVNLCERADVTIDDEPASPNNGRAVWHDYNAKAEAILREMKYTEDQDLEDDESPRRYHSQQTEEQVRQQVYLERLKKILPDEAFSEDTVFLRDLESQYQLEGGEWQTDQDANETGNDDEDGREQGVS